MLRAAASRSYKDSGLMVNRNLPQVGLYSDKSGQDMSGTRNYHTYNGTANVARNSPMLSAGVINRSSSDQDRSSPEQGYHHNTLYQRSSPASMISGGRDTYKSYPESMRSQSGLPNVSSLDIKSFHHGGHRTRLPTRPTQRSEVWLPTDSDTGHSTDNDSLPNRTEHIHNNAVQNRTGPTNIDSIIEEDHKNKLPRFQLSNVRQLSGMTGKPLLTSHDLNQFLANTVDSVHKARHRQTRVRNRQYFDALPDDLVQRIFSAGLQSDDLCRAATVCKRWYRIVWCPALWTTITLNSPSIDVDLALKSLTGILSEHTPTVLVILFIQTMLRSAVVNVIYV